MKERLSVYLDPPVMRSLIDYADRQGKSKSLIAEAAIGSFLSPDAAERQEATLGAEARSVGPTDRSGSSAMSGSRSRPWRSSFASGSRRRRPCRSKPKLPRAPKVPNGTMPSSKLWVGDSPRGRRYCVKSHVDVAAASEPNASAKPVDRHTRILTRAARSAIHLSFYASALRPFVPCCTRPRLALSNHP